MDENRQTTRTDDETTSGSRDDSLVTNDIADSVLATIKENPLASIAIGAAVLALATTPAGRLIRPAIGFAVSSGAAGALANAALKKLS